MGGRRRHFEPSHQLELAAPADMLNGAVEIARLFRHTDRWLRAYIETHPDFPVKQLEDGSLVAVRADLIDWIRHLPNKGEVDQKDAA